MRTAVIVFPGSNCDRDVALALERATGRPPLMLWHRDAEAPDVDLIVVPGGFAFGDYLRAGAIAAHAPAMRSVKAHAERGGLVLGICNGFQILTEAGMLEGALLRNHGLKFLCRDVDLSVGSERTPFTRAFRRGEVVRMPIAHNEGAYFADADTLARLEDEDRVVFRYCDEGGAITRAANPNGAAANVAGVVSRGRNVLGLMPHPERAADPTLGGTDGRRLFAGLLAAMV